MHGDVLCVRGPDVHFDASGCVWLCCDGGGRYEGYESGYQAGYATLVPASTRSVTRRTRPFRGDRRVVLYMQHGGTCWDEDGYME